MRSKKIAIFLCLLMVTAVFTAAVPGSVSAKPTKTEDIEEKNPISIHVIWKDDGYYVIVTGPKGLNVYLVIIDNNGEKTFSEMKYDNGEYSAWISKEIAKNKNDIYIAIIDASESLLPDDEGATQALYFQLINIDIKGKKDRVRLKTTTVLESKLLLETVYDDKGKNGDNTELLLRDITRHGVRKGAGPGSFLDLTHTIEFQTPTPDFNVDSFFDVFYEIDFNPAEPGSDVDSFFDITYEIKSDDLTVDSFFDVFFERSNKGTDFHVDSYIDVDDDDELEPIIPESFFDISMETDFNLPYPGRLGGDFVADSFFDVFYEIDFSGNVNRRDNTMRMKGGMESILSGGAYYTEKNTPLGMGSTRFKISDDTLRPVSVLNKAEGALVEKESFFDVFTELTLGLGPHEKGGDDNYVDSFFDVFTELSFHPGRTWIDPEGGIQLNSFFDVFTELSIDGNDWDLVAINDNEYDITAEDDWESPNVLTSSFFDVFTSFEPERFAETLPDDYFIYHIDSFFDVFFELINTIPVKEISKFQKDDTEPPDVILTTPVRGSYVTGTAVTLTDKVTDLGGGIETIKIDSFNDASLELGGSVDGSINENYEVSFDGSIELKNDVEKQFGESVKVGLSSGASLNVSVENNSFKGAELTGVVITASVKVSDIEFELEGRVNGSINENYEVSFDGSIELKNDVEKEFGTSVNAGIAAGTKLEINDSVNYYLEKTIFKGEVTYIEIPLREEDKPRVIIQAYDKLHRLTRGTNSRTWSDRDEPYTKSYSNTIMESRLDCFAETLPDEFKYYTIYSTQKGARTLRPEPSTDSFFDVFVESGLDLNFASVATGPISPPPENFVTIDSFFDVFTEIDSGDDGLYHIDSFFDVFVEIDPLGVSFGLTSGIFMDPSEEVTGVEPSPFIIDSFFDVFTEINLGGGGQYDINLGGGGQYNVNLGGGGQYHIDSFFDVFTELGVDQIAGGDILGLAAGDIVGLGGGDIFGLPASDILGLGASDIFGHSASDIFGLSGGDIFGSGAQDVLGLSGGDVLGMTSGDVFGMGEGDVLGGASGDILGMSAGDVISAVGWDVIGLGADINDSEKPDNSDNDEDNKNRRLYAINTSRSIGIKTEDDDENDTYIKMNTDRIIDLTDTDDNSALTLTVPKRVELSNLCVRNLRIADKPELSKDSFFDVFVESELSFNIDPSVEVTGVEPSPFHVESFFDVFAVTDGHELGVGQSPFHIDSFFDVFTEINLGGGGHYHIDSFFDVFVEIDDGHGPGGKYHMDSFFDVFTELTLDENKVNLEAKVIGDGGVTSEDVWKTPVVLDSFFDVFVETDLGDSGMYHIDSFFDVFVEIPRGGGGQYQIDSFFDIFTEIDISGNDLYHIDSFFDVFVELDAGSGLYHIDSFFDVFVETVLGDEVEFACAWNETLYIPEGFAGGEFQVISLQVCVDFVAPSRNNDNGDPPQLGYFNIEYLSATQDGMTNQMSMLQTFSYSGIEMQKNNTTIAGDKYKLPINIYGTINLSFKYEPGADPSGDPTAMPIPNFELYHRLTRGTSSRTWGDGNTSVFQEVIWTTSTVTGWSGDDDGEDTTFISTNNSLHICSQTPDSADSFFDVFVEIDLEYGAQYNIDSFFDISYEMDDDYRERECPECGASVGSDDKTCPECGEELPKDDDTYTDSFFDVFFDITITEVETDKDGGTVETEIVSMQLAGIFQAEIVSMSLSGVFSPGGWGISVDLVTTIDGEDIPAESFFDVFVEIDLPGQDFPAESFFDITYNLAVGDSDPVELYSVEFDGLPSPEGEEEPYWARLLSIIGSDKFPSDKYPELDDEVVVELMHEGLRFPVVIGLMHSDNLIHKRIIP